MHGRSDDPAKPHGHGFIAATSWKRAGNVVARPAREIATRPASSGWRSASSTSRSNSGSSSRNSTPWSALVTSPGDRCGPPPTIAAYDRVWCGARNGGRRRKLAQRTLAGGRRDDRRGERGGLVKLRQQARDRPREERLARSRRTDQQQAMAAGQGDLEGATRIGLAADLRQVRDGRPDEAGLAARDRARIVVVGHGPVARHELDPRRRNHDLPTSRRTWTSSTASRSRPTPATSIPSTSLASSTASDGDEDPPDPAPRQCRDHRQDTRHGPDLATERQLTDQGDPAGPGTDLLRAQEDPDGDRQVERCPGLPQVRRGEIDRDPSRRMREAVVAQRAADALPRLLEGGVGEPDDREPRQSRRDIDLDPDEPARKAVERRGWDDCQHDPNATRGRSPPGQPPLTRDLSGAGGLDGGCRDRLVDRPGEVQQSTPRAPSRPS